MDDESSGRTRHFTREEGEGVRILPEGVTNTGADDRRRIEPYMPESPQRRSASVPALASRTTAAITVEERREPARAARGPSTCSIVAATFGLLGLSCMLLLFATLQGGLDGLGKLTGIIPSISLPLRTPTVIIDTSRPSLVQSVRALSKLETVQYQVEKVISGKSEGPLPDFLTSDKILLVAHGEVVAGVDLGSLGEGDITVISDSVTIRLPNPQILYSKLDNDKTYVYDRQTGVFNKPDPNLESQMRAEAEKQIRAAAEEDGILRKARENAEQTLRTLVKGLGYEEVEFEEGP